MSPKRALEPVAVVEDSDEDFAALTRALRDAVPADAIVRFASGDEAVARAPSVRPALVLLDLNLPGLNGLDVLATLKAHPELHAVPVVVVSGSEREEDVEAAYATGANAYVAKSLDFAELRRRLTTLIGFWDVATLPPGDVG
jgi:CheY-like chemotaxis protein